MRVYNDSNAAPVKSLLNNQDEQGRHHCKLPATYRQVKNDSNVGGEKQRPERGAPERRICGVVRPFNSDPLDRLRPS